MVDDRCWTVDRIQGVTIISFLENVKQIDETCTALLGDDLEEVALKADPPIVVIDLAPVEFFGSSFIEILFRISRAIEKPGASFQLCNVAAYCREVLEVTNLTRLWKIYDSRSAAVTAGLAAAKTGS